MRRAIAAALVTLTVAGCAPTGGDLGTAPTLTNLTNDPINRANVGDRAVLYGVDNGSPMENIPLLLDATAHDKYERFRQSGTVLALAELEERKELQWTPTGTRVVVLETHDRSHTGSRLAAEVRLLDGPQKDRTLWTPLEYVTRFKAVEPE